MPSVLKRVLFKLYKLNRYGYVVNRFYSAKFNISNNIGQFNTIYFISLNLLIWDEKYILQILIIIRWLHDWIAYLFVLLSFSTNGPTVTLICSLGVTKALFLRLLIHPW